MPYLRTVALVLALCCVAGCGAVQVVEVCPAEKPVAEAPPAPSPAGDDLSSQ